MKKLTGPFLIFSLVFVTGCIPALKRHTVVSPKPYGTTTALLPTDLIDKKIHFLGKILQKKNLLNEDKQTASNLLKTYKSIKRASSAHLTESEYRKVIHTLFHSLSLIEEHYFAKEQKRVHDYSDLLSLFANKREEILDAYLAGDHKGVINHCLDLKAVFGSDALSPEIALLFALSLGKEGMLEDAIDIGEGIADSLELYPDLVSLRKNLVEWRLRLGQREEALFIYEKLTDILDEQTAILQFLAREIAATPKTDVHPETISDQHKPDQKISSPVEETTAQLIQKVDQLVHEHRFDEARDLLLSEIKDSTSTPDANKAVEQALKSLELAEEKYLERKISMISMLEKTLDLVRKLIEEERFEEAISSLDTLDSSQREIADIKKLKEKAILGLINRERNRAAKIFLAAKKTQDPVKREYLLRSSYEILNILLEQYPLSPLCTKVKAHMQSVAEELDKLRKVKQ